MGNCLNFSRLADRLVVLEAAFGIDEVGGKYGVDEGALSESGLACIAIALSACSFTLILSAIGYWESGSRVDLCKSEVDAQDIPTQMTLN
jgi:hypothetical protein